MTDSEPVSNVNEETKKTEQQETPVTIGKNPFSRRIYYEFFSLDKPAEEVAVEKPTEQQPQAEEKEVVATESTDDVETKDAERESKEPSSEPQFKDAEKVIEGEEEVYEEDNDSEYEDVDEEEEFEQGGNEEGDESNLASVQVRKRRFQSWNCRD